MHEIDLHVRSCLLCDVLQLQSATLGIYCLFDDWPSDGRFKDCCRWGVIDPVFLNISTCYDPRDVSFGNFLSKVKKTLGDQRLDCARRNARFWITINLGFPGQFVPPLLVTFCFVQGPVKLGESYADRSTEGAEGASRGSRGRRKRRAVTEATSRIQQRPATLP
jgi:hypothetical protein